MDESRLENFPVATFFLFIIFTKLVATRTSRLSMASTPRSPMARSQVAERVKAANALQNLCGTHFARFLRILRFSKEFRLQAVAKLCKRLGGEDRTLRPRHIFLSLVSVPLLIALFTRTCAREPQGLKAQDILRSFLTVIPSHSMFHRTLLNMTNTFSSFCSSPPQTTPDSLLLTRIRRTFCAIPPGGMQFGHSAESSPQTSTSTVNPDETKFIVS